MRDRLRAFINHTATEISIGILIVLSIVFTVLEVKSQNGDLYGYIAQAINAIFIIELTIRFYVERFKTRFFKTFWVDIIAVIPFSNLFRVLRIVRLLRLIRLGIVLTRRTRRMAAVINRSLAENMLIVVTLVVIFLIGAIGMYILKETNSFADAVWYSLFTLMGGEPIHGSAAAVSTEGKLITMLVMLGGFTMFAIFTGVVSAVMVERLRGGMDVKDVELEELNGHYLICGWHRSVYTIIRELQANSETAHIPIVLVAELEEEPDFNVPGINKARVIFIRGDYSSTEVLHRVRVRSASRAIILADKACQRSDQDRDARSILTALTIEKICQSSDDCENIYTCVELLNREGQKVKVLQLAGVEDIVEADEYMGTLIAHSTRARGLIQVLEELFTSCWGNEFSRRPLPSTMVGLTFSEAMKRMKEADDELLIAVIRGEDGCGGNCMLNPDSGYELCADDHVILITSSGDGDYVVKGYTDVASESDEQDTCHEASLRDHFIVAGWNRAAPKIIRELRENSETATVPIVVVAELPERPSELNEDDSLTQFISGDYTSTATLEDACVHTASRAILLADKSIPRTDQDRDARTVLAALTIEKMNRQIHTCVELLRRDPEKVALLKQANVEDVVTGDEYVGNLIAHAIRTRGLVQIMDELMTSNVRNEIRKEAVPEEWVGKPFAEGLAACKETRGGLIIAVESQSSLTNQANGNALHYISNPPRTYRFREGDYLFMMDKP